ncbi:MAG: glycosyltransferase, partial [Gammaproteobacteria bacterium]|nr:glycosyltransferase [Gammaproteobacteria bacterium]
AFIFSVVVYCAELFGIMTTLLHLFMTWNLTVRTSPPQLEGKTVDVFVPTYNEPAEMLRRTLLAAKGMRYDCKIWLLDDGNREEMKQLANDLKIEYIARTDNEHAKAGNLNNALQHSDGEFIAIFDCDHAPHMNFINNTIGYFRDEKVALVQTPQDFYNLDSYQHRKTKSNNRIWTEQSLFFRVIQRGKDYWNAAFFCGSCAIVRRTALEQIGGIATGTITEDLHTSIRLHGAGFKTIYHSETLAYGLAPSTITPFLSQRIRWGQGAMQVWKMEGILLNSNLTIAQRLNYFASMVTYFDGWSKFIFYLAPVIVLATGLMPISAINAEFLIRFIPYFLLTFWVFEEVGRGFSQSYETEQYNMARFAAFAWATLSLFKSPHKQAFKVTQKSGKTKSSKYKNTLPQLLITSFNIFAIPLGLFLFVTFQHLPMEGVIANIIWASVNAILGIGILRFTFSHQKFNRHDYRFPIPLPIRLHTDEDDPVYATIDNISATGCRIYGDISNAIEDDKIRGELILPLEEIIINGDIMARFDAGSPDDPYTAAYGVSFNFSNDDQRNEMERFLFGSSLQYDVLNLTEQGSTPLDKLRNYIKRENVSDKQGFISWSTALSKNIENVQDSAVILISEYCFPHLARDIITFKRIPLQSVQHINVFRRTGQYSMCMKVLKEKRLESPIGPLYKYKVLSCEL